MHPNKTRNTAILWAIFALFLIFAPFLATGWNSDTVWWWDWDFYFAVREIVRRSWALGGSLPAWSAHLCGGFPLMDSTEIPLFNPFVLLWQAIGPVPGAKWEYVITLAIGMIGMYKVAGEIAPKLSKWVRACGALQFVLSGFFILHVTVGHEGYAAFSFISWIIYGFLKDRVEPIAVSIGLMPIFAANNAFMHLVLFTVIIGAIDIKRWGKLVVQAGLWAATLAAPIVIYQALSYPEAKTLKFTAANHHELPRSLWQLADFLAYPETNLLKCDTDCLFEYGNFIGPGVLIIGLIGLAIGAKLHRRLRSWGIAAAIFLVIAMGPFSSFAPFALFVHFPLLNRLEVNTRFLLEFAACLFLGWFWLYEKWLAKKEAWMKITAIVTLALGVAASGAYAMKILESATQGKPLADLRSAGADMTRMTLKNDHRIGRYEALTTQTGISNCHVQSIKGDYPGKIQIDAPSLLSGPADSRTSFDGRYWWILWDLKTVQSNGAEWVINQNYFRDFSATVIGDPAISVSLEPVEGLLKVRAASTAPIFPGSYRIRIAPTPGFSIYLSLAIALISWAVMLTRFTLPRRKRVSQSG